MILSRTMKSHATENEIIQNSTKRKHVQKEEGGKERKGRFSKRCRCRAFAKFLEASSYARANYDNIVTDTVRRD